MKAGESVSNIGWLFLAHADTDAEKRHLQNVHQGHGRAAFGWHGGHWQSVLAKLEGVGASVSNELLREQDEVVV